jgi:1,4-dihydroxy-2-naphthoyl-CoA hydrolase
MSIWFHEIDTNFSQHIPLEGLTKTLDISFTKIVGDSLYGKMPVTKNHLQPYGLLHGGATIALGETLASVAAWLTLDPKKYRCVGQNVEANHLRPVSKGQVYGCASIKHKSRRQQVWDVEISDDEDRLISIQRITMAIIKPR